MEPTSNNASAKIISALIIGLIVGFIAGAFWQERRLSVPASASTASVVETKDADKAASAKTVEPVKDTKTDIGADATVLKAVSADKTTTVSASASVSPKLTVADQTAGDTVSVSVTGVSEPMWIAVRDWKDGKLGNILGAHKSFADEKATINLLRPTVPGGTYKVVMYQDVGVPSFDYKEDVLLGEGQVTFKAK